MRILVSKMLNIIFTKTILLVCGVFFSGYFAFFKLDAAENAIIQNRQNANEVLAVAGEDCKDSETMSLSKTAEEEKRKASESWEEFIRENNFKAIGEIYDNCDEKERKIVGRTILLPDVKYVQMGVIKGVKARTFINTTLESEVTGGRFFLEVKFNGINLYSNNWELCTVDEDFDDRLIYCPFNSGEYSFVKDRAIPTYLPKGRYESKAWITDQNDKIIVCGYSDFSL